MEMKEAYKTSSSDSLDMDETDIYEDDPRSNVQNTRNISEISVIAPLDGFQFRHGESVIGPLGGFKQQQWQQRSLLPQTGLERATRRASRTSRSAAGSTIRSTAQNQSPYKPRILALHGRKSNNDVTRTQMQNLKMSEDDYDIFYMKGHVKEDEGWAELEGVFHGPFYSWYSTDGSAGPTLIDAVLDVLKVAKLYGPFDGIYGFSNGAIVAAMAAIIGSEPLLLDTLQQRSDEDKMNDKKVRGFRRISMGMGRRSMGMGRTRSQKMLKSPSMKVQKSMRGLGTQMSTRGLGTQMSTRGLGTQMSMRGLGTQMSTRGLGTQIQTGTRGLPKRNSKTFGVKGTSIRRLSDTLGPDLEANDFDSPPFKFVILACTGTNSVDLAAMRDKHKIKFSLEPGSIDIPSFHIIGREDPFKVIGEEISTLFSQRTVMYTPSGHAVTRAERSDTDLTSSLETFATALGNPMQSFPMPTFKSISDVSSIGLLPRKQIALVKLNKFKLPEFLYSNGATILSLLDAQPFDKPFLYNTRVQDPTNCTTYGDVLSFIKGGDGDLRRLGVEEKDVVAYGAPPGGGAVSALTFLSIAAQTAAAPLAPSTSEPDTLNTLEQFHAKHLILFHGVKCPGVEAAFKTYAAQGKAELHYATISSTSYPGAFEYIQDGDMFDPLLSMSSFEKEKPKTDVLQPKTGRRVSVTFEADYLKSPEELGGQPLVSYEDDTCLLLRTSGTTARPKGVPLLQGALVTNGAIIASSMGLRDTDVCYSVMPLFHIGGISASILCTLASGGAVSCDGQSFDPSNMVDALALSRPQPTWYSSVPTIHNATVTYIKEIASMDKKYTAYGISRDAIWKEGHSLRMIRSGAAALLGPDGDALSVTYGGVPIYPTYSMSEQMPISQPPVGKKDTLTDKAGSVGVPVAASTCIVNQTNLRPLPPGEEGEIAISGPTVMRNYLENPDADSKSYFHLTVQIPEWADELKHHRNAVYFLTGDIGTLDHDGFLTLKGRAKELIKKGGEQVSPFEVEESLLSHSWLHISVCFAVPSKLYGEEVGCAIVLSKLAPIEVDLQDIIIEMRYWLRTANLSPTKWPTKWIIVDDEELPKTKTNKYIRINLSAVLGMNPVENAVTLPKNTKTRVDWDTLSGLRFILACLVMFMHTGSDDSWGPFYNLRGFPWHVHVFFSLGGYSMASPMNPLIEKKFKYCLARIGSMYPMYIAALFFCIINLLVVCNPSTFEAGFSWDSQPNDITRPLFCEGTFATPNSYWLSLFFTITLYALGLTGTPFWLLSWWLGFYLWFSSMYYWCLTIYPSVYNVLYSKVRGKTRTLFNIILGLLLLNYGVVVAAWILGKDTLAYNHQPDNIFAYSTDNEQYRDARNHNGISLGFYLFPPFWMLYFIIGVVLAFLYDAYRPAESHNVRIWGWIADGCTFIILAWSIVCILQGVPCGSVLRCARPDAADELPEAADSFPDNEQNIRLWDTLSGRIACPVTTLWIFSLSTGQGFTAYLLQSRFIVESLAPHSYNCFLFHQVVLQWYYLATRHEWWNWWSYRKTMFWFSPEPCPVEWYEYPYIVGLVVCFSVLMKKLEPLFVGVFVSLKGLIIDEAEDEELDTADVLCNIIEDMTGIMPGLDWALEECGLASVGIPVIVGKLNIAFSTKNRQVSVTVADLLSTESIGDMVDVVNETIALENADGV